MKTLSTLVTAAAMTFAAAPATASATSADVARITVSYADLNIASTAGRASFARRVTAAAARVCGGDATDLGDRMRVRGCRSNAVDAAMTAFRRATTPVLASR